MLDLIVVTYRPRRLLVRRLERIGPSSDMISSRGETLDDASGNSFRGNSFRGSSIFSGSVFSGGWLTWGWGDASGAGVEGSIAGARSITTGGSSTATFTGGSVAAGAPGGGVTSTAGGTVTSGAVAAGAPT